MFGVGFLSRENCAIFLECLSEEIIQRSRSLPSSIELLTRFPEIVKLIERESLFAEPWKFLFILFFFPR